MYIEREREIYIYIYIYTYRERERERCIRGRRRSATVPPNEMSRGHVGKTWQTMTTCGNTCALKQTMAKCKEMLPFCEKNLSVPTPSGSR